MTEEKELIKLLKEKNESSFKTLVNKYSDRVFNTVLSILQNNEDAEDITQDVFIEIFNSIKNFRGESKLYTWIYRISITKSLEYLKKKKRKKRFALLTSIFSEKEIIVKDFIHPGVLAENKERSAILFSAIDKLPDNQKIAFTLSYIENLSYKEISEIMKTTIPAVESLIHRAKIKLRKLLYKYYEKKY